MEVISICVSDIPKDKITTASNGKKYVNIVVDSRKEVDKQGNDLMAYMSQTKEEREAKADRVYVGGGKTYVFNNSNTSSAPKPAPKPAAKPTPEDDLPF